MAAVVSEVGNLRLANCHCLLTSALNPSSFSFSCTTPGPMAPLEVPVSRSYITTHSLSLLLLALPPPAAAGGTPCLYPFALRNPCGDGCWCRMTGLWPAERPGGRGAGSLDVLLDGVGLPTEGLGLLCGWLG